MAIPRLNREINLLRVGTIMETFIEQIAWIMAVVLTLVITKATSTVTKEHSLPTLPLGVPRDLPSHILATSKVTMGAITWEVVWAIILLSCETIHKTVVTELLLLQVQLVLLDVTTCIDHLRTSNHHLNL